MNRRRAGTSLADDHAARRRRLRHHLAIHRSDRSGCGAGSGFSYSTGPRRRGLPVDPQRGRPRGARGDGRPENGPGPPDPRRRGDPVRGPDQRRPPGQPSHSGSARGRPRSAPDRPVRRRTAVAGAPGARRGPGRHPSPRSDPRRPPQHASPETPISPGTPSPIRRCSATSPTRPTTTASSPDPACFGPIAKHGTAVPTREDLGVDRARKNSRRPEDPASRASNLATGGPG